MFELLQKHTVDLYNLTQRDFEIKNVSAKSLVTMNRFDLFAKMAYIKYRRSNIDYAKSIYIEHIKAFNPDLKEPGREDKNGIEDFLKTFDKLIDYFEVNEFDANISLIPISENGEILDGSHRIAALAFFNKVVSVVQFEDVRPVADFDYNYFLKRGLSRFWADAIAFESLSFTDNLFVACLWPKLGKIEDRVRAIEIIEEECNILYTKEISMTLNDLSMFVYEIYNHQDWVGDKHNNFAGARDKALNCYGTNKKVQFVIFKAINLDRVLKIKDEIRDFYKLEKHALHITDNDEETEEIFNLILTERQKDFSSSSMRFANQFTEFWTLFQNVYFLNFKVYVSKILKGLGVQKLF